jgi:hypothetical protein
MLEGAAQTFDPDGEGGIQMNDYIPNDKSSCELLLPYISGEASAEEKQSFERHLELCPTCREEFQDLKEVWEAIPFTLSETEAPEDLKQQVMTRIFEKEEAKEQDREASSFKLTSTRGVPERRRTKAFAWMSGLAAVLFLGIIIGSIWNESASKLRNQASEPVHEYGIPAKVVRTYELKPADPAMPAAKGNAWLVEQGQMNQVVVNLQGLQATRGDEAYQVWLIKEEKRYNCGTIRVDDQGTGVLAYNVNTASFPFQDIGVTLEPDPHGDQPRGRKILVTQ